MGTDKVFSAKRANGLPAGAVAPQEGGAMDAPSNVKRMTAKELEKELQAHFRRYVSAVWFERDPVTGEPRLAVEFREALARDSAGLRRVQ